MDPMDDAALDEALMEQDNATSWLEEAVKQWGPIDRRFMFGGNVYLAGGKMFAIVGNMGLALKLPAAVRAPLLQSGSVELFTPNGGATFGEWVALRSGQWPERAATLELVRESYHYVLSKAPQTKPERETRRFRKRQF